MKLHEESRKQKILLLMSYYCCYIKIDHYIVDLHYYS